MQRSRRRRTIHEAIIVYEVTVPSMKTLMLYKDVSFHQLEDIFIRDKLTVFKKLYFMGAP